MENNNICERREREREREIFCCELGMVWGGFWAGEQGLMSNGSAAAAHKPPSLLHLSISTAVSNIQRLSNLSCIPDNIVEELFVVSLRVFITCPNPSLRALSMDGSPLRAEKSFCKKQGPNAGRRILAGKKYFVSGEEKKRIPMWKKP